MNVGGAAVGGDDGAVGQHGRGVRRRLRRTAGGGLLGADPARLTVDLRARDGPERGDLQHSGGSTVSDIGVPDQGDQTIASALCEILGAACRRCEGTADYVEFKDGLRRRRRVSGHPPGPGAVRSAGRPSRPPVPGLGDSPGLEASSNYHGIGTVGTGAPDPQDGRYWFSLPLIYADRAGMDSAHLHPECVRRVRHRHGLG